MALRSADLFALLARVTNDNEPKANIICPTSSISRVATGGTCAVVTCRKCR
jgi:hypothetical protein